MFLLDADDSKVDGFKAAWAEIGDSIVVVGGDGVWNCHRPHRRHRRRCGSRHRPWAARIGSGVTDLLEEVAERHAELDAERDWAHSHLDESSENETTQSASESDSETSADAPLEPVDITEPDQCSVVAVGAGTGVVAMFESLGVHRVVAGGQSMNPSTEDLLTAVDSLPTGHVVVLPNNSNIVPWPSSSTISPTAA